MSPDHLIAVLEVTYVTFCITFSQNYATLRKFTCLKI